MGAAHESRETLQRLCFTVQFWLTQTATSACKAWLAQTHVWLLIAQVECWMPLTRHVIYQRRSAQSFVSLGARLHVREERTAQEGRVARAAADSADWACAHGSTAARTNKKNGICILAESAISPLGPGQRCAGQRPVQNINGPGATLSCRKELSTAVSTVRGQAGRWAKRKGKHLASRWNSAFTCVE